MAIVQFQEPSASSVADETALVRKSLSRLENSADASLGNPEKLASDVQGLIGGVKGEGGVSLIGGLKALRKIIGIVKQSATIARTTESRIQQAQNAGALESLFVQTAIVEMANVARDLEYESVDEALAVRDEVSGLLEQEAQATDNDETYKSLMKLRAGVSRDITSRSADLSRVETQETPMITNTILTSYQLYGDASRDQEIADRNNLPMPGFVSPSEPLKVLNG